MLVTDIKIRVKRQFGDEAAIQIQDEDIFRWITDAQLEIIRQNESLLQTTAVASTIVDQDEYTLPTDLMTLHSVKYNNFTLKGMNLVDFEEHIDGSDSRDNFTNGTPQVYYVWAGKFTLFPRPDTALTNGLKIYYTKKPNPVASDTDSLSVPEQYHNAIVNFCLQQAYELDEDWEASGNKASQMQEDLARLKEDQNWNTRATYPVISVLAEDM